MLQILIGIKLVEDLPGLAPDTRVRYKAPSREHLIEGKNHLIQMRRIEVEAKDGRGLNHVLGYLADGSFLSDNGPYIADWIIVEMHQAPPQIAPVLHSVHLCRGLRGEDEDNMHMRMICAHPGVVGDFDVARRADQILASIRGMPDRCERRQERIQFRGQIRGIDIALGESEQREMTAVKLPGSPHVFKCIEGLLARFARAPDCASGAETMSATPRYIDVLDPALGAIFDAEGLRAISHSGPPPIPEPPQGLSQRDVIALGFEILTDGF